MNGRTLVVLDGLLTLEEVAPSNAEYRKFVHELQGLAGIEDCVVLMTGGGQEDVDETMADGVITLEHRRAGAGAVRELEVRKIRGTDFLGGGTRSASRMRGLRSSRASRGCSPSRRARAGIETSASRLGLQSSTA